MKKIQTFFLFLMLLTVSAFQQTSAEHPKQDCELVYTLKDRHIRLIVLRHGEANNNVEDFITSTLSPGIYLTEEGIKQTKEAAAALKEEEFIDAVYVSPAFRSLQTASSIAKRLELPFEDIHIDQRLRQQYFGTYEGKSYSEFKDYFPGSEEMFAHSVPGAEEGINVYYRTLDLLWDIAEHYENDTVLLITHGLNAAYINKALTNQYREILDFAGFRVYEFEE